jgi:general secretion pathway protein A
MEYFNLLEFNKEPFSNSPEPEFLFTSPQHNTCLQRLELAVRLRRGLNIVIGPVGAGKTTLCRKLIQNLSLPVASDAPVVETFLLLDPSVAGTLDFVKTVAAVLGIGDIDPDCHEWQIKEKIKTFLFEQGIQQQKNIVLIIDEGQKIPDDCLEILREFLNYETNSFKLLQIVIFAQPEFRKNLTARANLLDRVNYLYHLRPLSFRQMKAMIEHRIAVASIEPERRPLFTFGAMMAIYNVTAGYPRKVVSLCHQILLLMIIRRKSKADWFLVRSCQRKTSISGVKRISWATLGLLVTAVFAVSSAYYWNGKVMTGSPAQNQRLLSGIDIKTESSNALPLYNTGASLPAAKAVEDHGQIQAAQLTDEQNQRKMPDYFGEIVMKKKMTIWWMMDNIYGETGNDLTERMIQVNPGIKNIDNVFYGTAAKVPLIPEKARLLKQDAIIVALDKSNNLEKIYYSYIEKKDMDAMPAMLFLALWNKQEGRHFAIALDKPFISREEAEKAIRRLPSELAGSARVLSRWDGDTFYFNSRFIQ